jgi:hypothetical protein
MNQVKKLWYNSDGELRLLKEWINPYEFGDRLTAETSFMVRIKADSLPVVNPVDVSFALGHTGTYMRDSFHDIPGATWDLKNHMNPDAKAGAFIHLPKAEKKDAATLVGDALNRKIDEVDILREQLTIANKRISELEHIIERSKQVVSGFFTPEQKVAELKKRLPF